MIDSDKSLSLNYANVSVRNVLLFYPVYLKSSTVAHVTIGGTSKKYSVNRTFDVQTL